MTCKTTTHTTSTTPAKQTPRGVPAFIWAKLTAAEQDALLRDNLTDALMDCIVAGLGGNYHRHA